MANEGILPCRSKESLKNFWKNWKDKEVDDCIEQMRQKDTKYCHNFKEAVYPHQPLPSEKTKSGNKRTKEEVEKQDKDTNEFI